MKYLKERITSFKYAFEGIGEVLRSQANPKIHLVFAVVVIIFGGYFNISTVEWCLLVACIAAVLSAETMNTAIEHLTDLVSPEYHPLAKKTKDAAAGGVLWMAIGAVIIGLIIFLPRVVALFGY